MPCCICLAHWFQTQLWQTAPCRPASPCSDSLPPPAHTACLLTRASVYSKGLVSHASTGPRCCPQPRQDRFEEIQVGNSGWYSAGLRGAGRRQPPLPSRHLPQGCLHWLSSSVLLSHFLTLASQDHLHNWIHTPKSLCWLLLGEQR